MIWSYGQWATLIAAVSFLVAFIFTFSCRPLLIRSATSLFMVGCLASIGMEICWRFFEAWFIYHMTDSNEPNTIALVILVLPVTMAGYAIASCIYLWPGIPRAKAIHVGKILHLVVLPLLVLVLFVLAFLQFRGVAFGELNWLIYGPLWFRIREKMDGVGMSENRALAGE